eukprot:jgi/Psemu1/318366/estExt_fgenesh1_pm.C_680015
MMAASKAGGDISRTKKRIKSALIGAGLKSIDGNVLSKCVALASTLSLSPETMAEVWEAHSLNKQNLTELTMHQFEAYKNELIKTSSTAPIPDAPPTSSSGADSPRGATLVSRKETGKREVTMVTPLSSGSKRPNGAPPNVVHRAPANLPKYDERTNVGQLVASHPSDRSRLRKNEASPNTRRSRCVLTTSSETVADVDTDTNTDANVDVTRHNITKPYRHMFTTMEDRAAALEHHLVRMKEAIGSDIRSETERKTTTTTTSDLPAPLEEVNVPRQDPSTCIGRICNEAHTGRLNATSVVLEGSSSSCGGARVNVDLSKIKSQSPPQNLQQQQQQQQQQGYSLFPGQIVAIEGMNGTGRKITASGLREGAHLLPATSSASSIRNFYCGEDGDGNGTATQTAPLKVVSACGPFTTSNSMEYAPFIDLMGVVIDEQPDVVMLMGPFVDVRQEAVKSGAPTGAGPDGEDMVMDYETIFSQNISQVIEEFFEQKGDCRTEFVLVPALEDATAKGVYPQPPLQDRFPKGARLLDIPGAEMIAFGSSGIHELTRRVNGKPRVHCLSNPCTFRVNEMVFGVTSTDVLFHMSVEETNANLPVGSRMRRISQHMIRQQSYYPLFPPNKSVNLDLKQQDGWKMPCQPDVLIIPSRLTPFCAPIMGSTMAVNPGHLSKGTTGGTYALMTIRPMDREKLNRRAGGDDSALLTHDAPDRMQVEIKRI